LQVPVQPHDPPRTRALRVRQHLGQAGEALALELEALDRSRYAQAGRPGVARGWWKRFAELAAQAGRR
jgi:protein-glutamine gamma-glutamyltransferase